MVDWKNDEVFGRLTYRDIFTVMENPDAEQKPLILEKELNYIYREIRDADSVKLEKMLKNYKEQIPNVLSFKNPWYEERRGWLIARYMQKIIGKIEEKLDRLEAQTIK